MRFLADESCDFAVVRALRDERLDVVAISEVSPRATDGEVIAMARDESRVLLTEDKDFGQLVYASGAASTGVVLFRFPAEARKSLPGAAINLVRDKGSDLTGRFIVVQPGRVRIGPALER